MKYGNQVKIKNTGGMLDGKTGKIIGIAANADVKIFIVGFKERYTVWEPDHQVFEAVTIPEVCLELL